ncbi:MAG: hypothetical protein HQ574_04880, partial [Chloroflexi bacterium]|nr:hypothetical protein [Chloroflexota bacterium]
VATSLRTINASHWQAKTSGTPYTQAPITLDIGQIMATLTYDPTMCICTLRIVNHAPAA